MYTDIHIICTFVVVKSSHHEDDVDITTHNRILDGIMTHEDWME